MKSKGSVSEIVGSLLPLALILLFGWFWRDYVSETLGPHGPRSEQERRRMEERYLGSNPERQARNLVRSGRKLSDEQAAKFEASAADGDLSEAGRARLLGYYSRLGWRNQEARLAQEPWESKPSCDEKNIGQCWEKEKAVCRGIWFSRTGLSTFIRKGTRTDFVEPLSDGPSIRAV